jgi:hypothetical protein
MHVCRICKKPESHDRPVYSYAMRHWVHAECAMERWGAAAFDRFYLWQLLLFPWFVAKRLGLTEALERKIAELRSEEPRS